jgi:Plasmid pRiA4b ORF-3-like protein
MNDPTQLSIYQLRAVLNGVNPLVWRRFLLCIETSLADLHNILQLAFGWSGFYLYEFCAILALRQQQPVDDALSKTSVAAGLGTY